MSACYAVSRSQRSMAYPLMRSQIAIGGFFHLARHNLLWRHGQQFTVGPFRKSARYWARNVRAWHQSPSGGLTCFLTPIWSYSVDHRLDIHRSRAARYGLDVMTVCVSPVHAAAVIPTGSGEKLGNRLAGDNASRAEIGSDRTLR